jgi:alkaline phosphatase
MAYELYRKDAVEPSLIEMTEKAIEILSRNKNGYFLFVEGL